MCFLSCHLIFCMSSSAGNYNNSLNDAKVATDLQPSLVKAIATGKISEIKMYTRISFLACVTN